MLPFWSELNDFEKQYVESTKHIEKYTKGMIVHRTEDSCKGLLKVLKGQLRIYILSEEGKEVTLYRVPAGEVCVLSVSCLLDSITFDILIEATEESEVMIVPTPVLNQIISKNTQIELYLYKAAAEKFSDVMWTMQQILFLKIDQRVANFLWEEMIHRNSTTLTITHDEVAKYIGSAREVVTKVMKYLSQEKIVELKRGTVNIIDKDKLRKLL